MIRTMIAVATLLFLFSGAPNLFSQSKAGSVKTMKSDGKIQVEKQSTQESSNQESSNQDAQKSTTRPKPPKSAKRTTSDRKISDTRVNDMTFDDLVFDMKKGQKFKRSMLTERIESLNKKKIRLRGYIRPSFKSSGLTKFIFVRDNKECCFGPGAALYDCVIVILKDGNEADYTVRPVTVEGEFYFKELKIANQTMAIYRMKNAVVKK